VQKNRILLAGYLAAKPEVRYLPSGTPVANARLAEGYKFKDRNGEIQEHTNWHTVVFYGDLSDIAVTFDKGDNIFVEGTLQTRKFTPRDGSQRTVYEVVSRSVHEITKQRLGKEAPPDNEPHANERSVSTEPAQQPEVEDDGEIWPS
jgi:single-strand DNA-binding protein